MEEQQSQEVPLEVMAPSAIESMERAAVDVQVATAHKFPRSLELFKKRALAQVTMDAEVAESCIYVREVGSKQVNGRWVKEYAEGPSIRLAEIAFNAYGNIRAASDIIEQTPRYVKAQGWAWDMETNVASKMTVIENTVKKNGEPYSESMRTTVAKAAQAKAWRDAVLKVIGKAVCKPLIQAAKKVMAGEGKTMEARLQKVQGWLSYRKIGEERVFAALGINGWGDMTEEHLLTLSGLKTAIMEGEQDVEEAFPHLSGTKAPEQPGQTSKSPQQPGQTKTAAKAPEKKPEPPKEETAKSEEKELADMGLAPEKPQEPPKAPEPANQPEPVANVPQTAAEPAQQQQQGTPETSAEADPKWEPKSGDSDAWASLKLVARKSGVRYSQVLSWARVNKIAKENQSLEDLSENKLLTMANRFPTLLPKIKETKV